MDHGSQIDAHRQQHQEDNTHERADIQCDFQTRAARCSAPGIDFTALMHEKSANQGRCLFSAEYLYLGLQERVLSTSKRGWTTVSMPKFLIITADDFGYTKL